MLNRTFGCVRVVWNRTLAWRHARWYGEQAKTGFTQANAYLTAMKASEELEWLNEYLGSASAGDPAPAGPTPTSLPTGPLPPVQVPERPGDRRVHPLCFPEGRRAAAGEDERAAGFVWSWPDIDPAAIDPTTVTVSRDPCGRWHASFALEVADPVQLPATGAVVGVDLGIKDFAVTSDGEHIANPRDLAQRDRNLARYQRRMARCQRGSANRQKAKAKVARAHRKVRASRTDFLHRRAPAWPGRRPDRGGRPRGQVHGPEPVAGQGHQRLRGGTFRHDRVQGGTGRAACDHGQPLVPSSKTCCSCGHLLAELSLKTRTWQCPSCGTRHDRDINAAKNILAAGLAVAGRNPGDACGADVRPQGIPPRQSAVKQEPQLVRA